MIDLDVVGHVALGELRGNDDELELARGFLDLDHVARLDLEARASPPPPYNFAFTPVVHEIDAWWDMKKRGYTRPLEGFKPIHMPRNTATGVIIAALSVVFSFAIIWYIWWLTALSFVAMIGVAIWHTFNYNRDYTMPADVVVRAENERTALLAGRA